MAEKNVNKRWFMLAVGILSMLFSGVLYAWSILKVPFKETFGWSDSVLSLSYTLTLCFFCIGAFLGSILAKRIGVKLSVILAGAAVGTGFVSTAFLTGERAYLIYVTYALLAGTGIGIAYNVIISTVSAWFPDKKGLCSGCLMMGFGASTLILGNLIAAFFENESIGFQKTYVIVGIAIAAVLVVSGLLIRKPDPDTVFPAPKAKKSLKKEDFETKDYTTAEMVKRFTYWRAFVCLVFLTAVGSSVIGFARDLVLSVGGASDLATTLVGVLAVFNGIGRILTGALFDNAGRKNTMILSNVVTILAAATTLVAVCVSSLPLCIVGLCLTGLSYGSCPTVVSAFTSAFYGTKHFAKNFSITQFSLIGAALISSVNGTLLQAAGSYVAPFVVLLSLASVALVLNFSIKKP